MRARRAVLTCALAGLALVLPGCGKRDDDRSALRAIIAASEISSRSFIYTEQAAGTTTEVRGQIEDDQRYKAVVRVDGTPTFDEVVTDDSVADRVLTQSGLARFASKKLGPTDADGASSGGKTKADPALQAKTVQLLQAQRWVVDDDGAPTLAVGAKERRTVGDDPIIDSLTVLRYVEAAIIAGGGVTKFNPDSLDYKPKEDPFPKPDRSKGLERYDVRRPKLPKASQQTSGGTAVVPLVQNFRKMSVYVKGGKVVRVVEDIDVASRLKELRDNFDIKFGNVSEDEAVMVAVGAINDVIKANGGGAALLRVRTMSFDLTDFGAPADITLPSDATAGDLSIFINRGRVDPTAKPTS